MACTRLFFTSSWWKKGILSSRRQRVASGKSPASRYSVISSSTCVANRTCGAGRFVTGAGCRATNELPSWAWRRRGGREAQARHLVLGGVDGEADVVAPQSQHALGGVARAQLHATVLQRLDGHLVVLRQQAQRARHLRGAESATVGALRLSCGAQLAWRHCAWYA